MATAKEREEFIAHLVADYCPAHSIYDICTAARALLRHARTHGNLAVDQCNGAYYQLTGGRGPAPSQERIDAWEAQREKREAACEKRIKEICAEFNLPVTLGGDPRGYTVKVKLPSGAYNTWGGSEEGYGVPQ